MNQKQKKAYIAVIERMSMAGWTESTFTSVGVTPADVAEIKWKKEGLIALKLLRGLLTTTSGDPITISEYTAFALIVSDPSLQYLDKPGMTLGKLIVKP